MEIHLVLKFDAHTRYYVCLRKKLGLIAEDNRVTVSRDGNDDFAIVGSRVHGSGGTAPSPVAPSINPAGSARVSQLS